MYIQIFVCFRTKMFHLLPRNSLIVTRFIFAAYNRRFCSKDPPKLPEEPTTCCMSGCANCVWIEYAEKVKNVLGDKDSRYIELVLEKIQDPNMKAFLSMELKSKKL